MFRNATPFKKSIAMLGLLAALVIATTVQASAPMQSQVNVNTASVQQLMEIPGIGQAKAQAIVEHRAKSPFATTAELMEVRGIGEKLLAKITPYVTTGSSSGTADKARK